LPSQETTLVIALVTVVVVAVRPRGLNEGIAALAGGGLLLLTGRLTLGEARDAAEGVLPVLFFLAGLFWITLGCERAGLFDLATERVLGLAGGSSRRLLALVFALGFVTTAILSNDATVVLLTPMVLRACRSASLPPLPYLFACTFVADTASSSLPIANPVNLLFAEEFEIAFTRHLALMLLPTIVAVVVNALLFDLLFRRQLPVHFHRSGEGPIATHPATRGWFRPVVVALVVGYAVATLLGVEPHLATVVSGGLIVLALLVQPSAGVREIVRVQPPGLYAFVVGLALLIAAVEAAGLLDWLGNLLTWGVERGDLAALLTATFGTALGTNIVNNWTMSLAIIPAVEQAGASDGLIFGAILGADVGPNLTVFGSLATLIWLTETRRAGLAVSARTYLRLGVITTIPALLAAALVLYVMLWVG
jgi:arsenical pump membrane protein